MSRHIADLVNNILVALLAQRLEGYGEGGHLSRLAGKVNEGKYAVDAANEIIVILGRLNSRGALGTVEGSALKVAFGKERVAMGVVANAAKPVLIGGLDAVGVVLRKGADSEIATRVIQAVEIDVIDDLTGPDIHNQTVHQCAATMTPGATGIEQLPRFVFLRSCAPRKLQDTLGVFVINECDAAKFAVERDLDHSEPRKIERRPVPTNPADVGTAPGSPNASASSLVREKEAAGAIEGLCSSGSASASGRRPTLGDASKQFIARQMPTE